MKNRTFIIWVCIILAVFCALLAFSCSKRNKTMPKEISAALKSPFDAKATIKMKDLVLNADVNRSAQRTATIKVNEPKTLAGMCFTYDGEDVTITYHGLSVKLNEDSKLVSSLVSVIVNSIDKAASPSGVDVNVDGNKLIVSGKSDSGKFNITLDKNNNSIVSINVPQLDFECNFSDFIFKK